MAGLPVFMRKLFANSGFGPLLNLDIMPIELQRRTADTGSIVLPTGTTAQRDASASKGSLRFNSTTGNVEVYTGSAWKQVVTSSDGRGVPLGTCSMHMCRISGGSVVAPEGYLICDGSQINHSDYPDLCELLWQFTAFAGNGSSYALLPNLHHRFLEGTTSVGEIATYVEAGLPDITGWVRSGVGGVGGTFGEASGAFYINTDTFDSWQSSSTGSRTDDYAWNADFRASKANSVYGNSSTVQTPSLMMLPCIKF